MPEPIKAHFYHCGMKEWIKENLWYLSPNNSLMMWFTLIRLQLLLVFIRTWSWLDMSHHMIVISWFSTVVIADLSTVNCCTPLLLPCFLSIGIQPSRISNLCYLLNECGLSNFTNINFAAFTVNPLTHAIWFSQIRSFFQPYRSVSAA